MPRQFIVGSEPAKVVPTQRLTDPRKGVHHLIVVLSVIASSRENEATVSVEELVPCGIQPAFLEFHRPVFHRPTFEVKAAFARCSGFGGEPVDVSATQNLLRIAFGGQSNQRPPQVDAGGGVLREKAAHERQQRAEHRVE